MSEEKETPRLTDTGKVRARTLGEWERAFLASGEVPKAQAGNVRTLFRHWSRLLSGQEDPDRVDLTLAKGLRRKWEQELEARRLNKEKGISSNTVRQYRMWAHKAIRWAQEHLDRFTMGYGAEVFDSLDGEMWTLVDHLEKSAPQVEHLGVRRFFESLEKAEVSLQDLPERVEELLVRFEEELQASGVRPKTWKRTYRDALRGLRRLQGAGLLSDFPLRPHTSRRVQPYAMPYPEFPNTRLREMAERYDRRASDSVKMGDDTWPFRPVSDVTRKNNLRALQQYIGYLENIAGLSTVDLEVEEIFSASNLAGFARFYLDNQGQSEGDITGGLMSQLKRLQVFARRHLGLPEDLKGRDRFACLYQHARVAQVRPIDKRIRWLHQWAALMAEARRQAQETTDEIHALCLERLRVYCLVLLSAPVRPGSIRMLELDRHLVRDPMTGRLWVRLPPEMTKTRKSYEIILPDRVQKEVEVYLAETRPKILKGKRSPYVFPSEEGNPVADEVILSELSALDCEVHGNVPDKAVYPYTVRHTAVMTCARKLGREALYRAGKLVGHASVDTTLKFYASYARRMVGRDREAERILKKASLSQADVDNLVQTLVQDPVELARFARAFRRQHPEDGRQADRAV